MSDIVDLVEFKDVKSSWIKSVGYLENNMYVKLNSGAIYVYKNVNKCIYDGFLEKVGSFDHI